MEMSSLRCARANDTKFEWIGVSILVGALAVVPAPVGAAGIPCPPDVGWDQPISDNVLPSTGCMIGTDMQDSQQQVRDDQMFGFSDWLFGEKWGFGDGAEQTFDLGLIISDDGDGETLIDGLWSLNPWGTISHIMLVFKDGAGQPDAYVGYLLTQGATFGTYLTPFLNPQGGTAKEISHISAYYRLGGGGGGDPETPVPEPATLLMVGGGFGLLARRLRRRVR